jgi:DNA-binding HxlR family transcriptional regulator
LIALRKHSEDVALEHKTAKFIFIVLYFIIVKSKTIDVEFAKVRTELSEELKDEIRKLKEELANLKEQLRDVSEARQRRSRGLHIDVGGNVQDYIEDVMEGVAEGIHGELERSIFIGPRGVRILKGGPEREERETEVSFPKVAEVMSALGQEHRLRILDELMTGGKYINDLQEKLSEITTSTLSSHLKVLEEAGLVVQEKVRGRYLITVPGRAAYRMARRIARFMEEGSQE